MPKNSSNKITQELIVDVALEIANEGGIDAVTMANIARKLKIRSPSLYNHFSSLHDIKQAVACRAQSILVEFLMASMSRDNSGVKLKTYALAYYRFACQYTGYYEASIIALDSSKGLSSLPVSKMTSMLMNILEPYQIDEEMTIHSIRILRSMLHGLIDLNKKDGFKLNVDIEETLEHAISLFIRGLKVT